MNHQSNTVELPSTEEVLACSFSSWYKTFSNLPSNDLNRKNCTIKSKVIPLPENFRQYMLQDGVQLPKGIKATAFGQNTDGGWSSDEDGGENEDGLDEYDFTELNEQIRDAMSTLGGYAIPKLNWSAPKDAIWVNANSLKCSSLGDLYLMIKSSDFCSHDVQYALKDVHDSEHEEANWSLELVLRKWCNLYPSQEFRCFVRNHELVAISQRIHSQHFPHLPDEKERIRDLLTEFYEVIILKRFAGGKLPNFVFDAYIDTKNKTWLLDFNVWNERTDSLLFEWDELRNIVGELQVRVVETPKEIRADPLTSYRAPIDTVHLASLTGSDAEAFRHFMSTGDHPVFSNEEE